MATLRKRRKLEAVRREPRKRRNPVPGTLQGKGTLHPPPKLPFCDELERDINGGGRQIGQQEKIDNE